MALSLRTRNSRRSREDEYTVLERSPTGQYARYDNMIEHQFIRKFGNYIVKGSPGILKEVYKGFDGVNGREIVWSKMVQKHGDYFDSLCSEANLLQKLDHENIMKCYHYINHSNDGYVYINMITQLFSANLRDYTKKHMIVGCTAIKNWCRQILTGLDYLHNRTAPMIHRNLTCENIFVLGRSGRVKIGVNWGDAMILEPGSTIEGNAKAEAAARAEVYCFGMCVLQMVTKDVTLSRCNNKRVILDVLRRERDPELQKFIHLCLNCLSPESVRPTVTELLQNPFLDSSTAASGMSTVRCNNLNMRLSVNNIPPPSTSDEKPRSALPPGTEIVKECDNEHKKYILQGIMMGGDLEMISMTCSYVHVSEMEFEFSLKSDNVLLVIKQKLEPEIGRLKKKEITLISRIMEQMITEFKAIISSCDPYLPRVLSLQTSGDARRQICETSSEQNQATTPSNRSQPNQDAEMETDIM